MKKGILASIFWLFLFILSSTAFAWSPQLEGKPEAFHRGEVSGYFIWYDDNGMHLRTATRGQVHNFSGTIRTDGRFIDVQGIRLEAADAYKIGPDKHEIKFTLDTGTLMDGFDFKVEGGEKVVFELLIDGHPVPADEIHGGSGNWHPNNNVFEILK
jgi:hypothetical protein